MTEEELTRLILGHCFDDGSGTERKPFVYKQFEVTSRAMHPRYGLLVSGSRKGREFKQIRVSELVAEAEGKGKGKGDKYEGSEFR